MTEKCLMNHKTPQTSKSCQGILTELDTHLKDMARAAARDELQTEGGCRRVDIMLGDDWRHDLCTWQTDDQVEHSRTLVT